eukprot:m.257168 g.257168  ORF g.257168 m.257168 type:complete len:66 (-) comp15525_c6_seq1:511-708(-)
MLGATFQSSTTSYQGVLGFFIYLYVYLFVEVFVGCGPEQASSPHTFALNLKSIIVDSIKACRPVR